jgi:tetratricopeptide (TPR) repeat protein
VRQTSGAPRYPSSPGCTNPFIIISYGETCWDEQAGSDLQAKYAQAEEGLRQALAIRRKVLGEEHPDTAASYNNLAVNQGYQGQYAQAEEGYRKALAIQRKVLGEDHPHTAISYSNLTSIQQAQAKYAQAEEGYRKALAIKRKVLGEEHPDTALSYTNLASNHYGKGQYAQAEEGVRKALAIYRKVLGEEPAEDPAEDPAPSVPVIVWRDGRIRQQPLFVRPGKLGVVLADKPGPQAAARRCAVG